MGNAISTIGRLLANKDWECKSNCPAGVSCDCSLEPDEQNKEKKEEQHEDCVRRENASRDT